MDIPVKKLQDEVDRLVQKFGGYWSDEQMLLKLVEEVGELARELNKRNVKKKDDKDIDIPGELCGILFAVICIANMGKLDLGQEMMDHIDHLAGRDKDRFTEGKLRK